ncbi:MAG: ABC transporter permease subunit, partial [Planctomycetes bacterium]|nr:ABC transporter permease subunit [Planctomycetota bacterium]
MTTAQASLDPMIAVHGRRVSRAAALWNLFTKELRESRSAMIVGAFGFWLMPVFLGLVACVVGPGREEGSRLFGVIAYALLLSSGWLFAAAFGAIVVCRDWGRSEEHFLLSQPVTPRWVVAAKLLAAVAVVGLIVGVLLVIVHLLMLLTVDSTHREDLSVPEALVVCLVVASLALSFSIAVITRQTSASLVLTMLIMALGIAAPLVSTRFSFLH